MSSIDVQRQGAWDDDVLRRKPYADFLTAYLISRVKGEQGQVHKSFTLALDAQWGQGKTFFVKHWAEDLKRANPSFPILLFDAWNADFGDDPLIALMASFRAALQTQIAQSDQAAAWKEKANQTVSSAVRGFRRAIVPAGKQIAKALIKKGTGIAVDELVDLFGSEQNQQQPEDSGRRGDGASDVVDKGLDEFFTKALEEQAGRKKAVEDFRSAVSCTLKMFEDLDGLTLPMFVFIDEVDRCRPTFAIALLEGVKHLFDIPGVCFVVSTNIKQLSEAVRAVYGPGFDGKGYLKRLFNVEYTLPPVDASDYAHLLLREYPELLTRAELGMPATGFLDRAQNLDIGHMFGWVAEAFELDLRSQRKVVEMMSAAQAGVPDGKKVFLLWLAVLCAIRHKDVDEFELIASGSSDSGLLERAWKKLAPMDKGRTIATVDQLQQKRTTKEVRLYEVAWQYVECAFKDLTAITEATSRENTYDYPRAVIHAVAAEMPHTYYPGRPYVPSIRSYFQLVRTAGHISEAQ